MPRALSTNVGAIRQRATRAAAKSRLKSDDGIPLSSEPIGVLGTPPDPPAPEPAKSLYYCLGCNWALSSGLSPCPGCGEELVWPESS